MTKYSKNLSLKYLNGRINRLKKRFDDFERTSYHWQQQNMKDIDELKAKPQEPKVLDGSEERSSSQSPPQNSEGKA